MKFIQKGFTLIELLIVIAVIGVLAAIVIAALDPIDKINAANDSKVQADINAMASAEERYATTTGNGNYGTMSQVSTAGEIRVQPSAPNGYTYNLVPATPTTTFTLWAPLKSKKYTATPFWVYCSTSGKAGATTSQTSCP